LISDLENRSLQTLPGKVMPVLVEGPSLRDQSALTGRTRCNRVVNFDAPVRIATGSTENVRISEVRGHTLWGELDNRPV
jgi:tRNA-2-methylthio-N6-dimethylallyladenosine synthase